MSRFRWLALFLVLGNVAGNCPDNDGSDDDPTPSATPPQSALSVEFSDLTFEHVVGTSPCPQPIGTVTITNATAAEANVTLSVQNASPAGIVILSATETTIAPGGSTTVDIQFDCGAWDGTSESVSATVEVDVDNGTKSNINTANVTGTVTQ